MTVRTDLAFNRAIINMAALRHNFREIKGRAPGRQIMALVENDAYGHGMTPSALALAQAGADSLGVANVIEGMTLRVNGLTLPIHILGGLQGQDQVELAVAENLSVFVYDREQIMALAAQGAAQGRIARYHLVVDTGMNCLGFSPKETEKLLPELVNLPNAQYLGLATNLASVNNDSAHEQLHIFDQLCYRADSLGLPQDANSALCSAGIMTHGNHMARLVRPGQALYGLQTGAGLGPMSLDLRPVMQVESRIIQIKELLPGSFLAGDHSFPVPKKTKIAVVPFGYARGLLRVRSNLGWALIGGQTAPLLGRISLNTSMYDISNIDGVKTGDQVVIIGRQLSREIKAHQVAAWNRGNAKEATTLFGSLNMKFFEGSDYEIDDEA